MIYGGFRDEVNLSLTPIKGTKNSDVAPTKLSYLCEIAQLISQTFGDLSAREEQIIYINHLTTILRKNDTVLSQIKNNPKEIAMQGNLPRAVRSAIMQALSSHQRLSSLLLKDSDQALEMRALYSLPAPEKWRDYRYRFGISYLKAAMIM